MSLPSAAMDITVGPIAFFWKAETVNAFYRSLLSTPQKRVVIGEWVCSKRLPFWADEIPTAVEALQAAGKDVALSTLGLITLKRERQLTRDLFDMGVPVEINDFTALAMVPEGQPFWVGPLVNVYNEGTLAYLARRGAKRICLPPELPLASIRILAAVAREEGVALEVWGHGRLPLAISGRCYHARLHDRAKDNCQFVCGEDPDGRDVATLDDAPFLVVNGVQTLSQTYACMALQMEALAQAGVRSLRLSPQSGDFAALVNAYAATLAGRISADELVAQLRGFKPEMDLSDGYISGPQGAAWSGRHGVPQPPVTLPLI